MNSMALALLTFLIGSGGSDLLDYASPSAYWKEKQVALSVESMTKELTPPAPADISGPLEDLNSPDSQVRQQSSKKIAEAGVAALPALEEAARSGSPQVSHTAKSLIRQIESANRPLAIRRLMAIRELGELNDKSAVSALEPLLKEKEPFVADYAREAIDRINGKSVARSHAVNLRDDVWLLPAGCRAVGQVLGPTGGPVSVEALLTDMPLQAGANRESLAEGVQHTILTAAQSVGNVRFESLSFGISGDVAEQSGYVVLIARGKYDARALADFCHRQQMPSNRVGGAEVFQPPGGEMALLFPSDEYAILIGSPRGVDLPIQEILDALNTRQGKLRDVPEMKKLVEQAPAGQPLWAVATVTPAYAKAPILEPFRTLELQSRAANGHVELSFSAIGTDPAKAKSVAQSINAGVQRAAEQMRHMQDFIPAMAVFAKAMKTVRCEAVAGNATVSASMDDSQSPLGLLLVPMLATAHPQAGPATRPAR